MEKSIKLTDTKNLLINLDRAPERLEKSTKVLTDLEIPFERFSAVEHSQGIIGCGLSHQKLLSEIKPNTLIMEDDIGSMPQAPNVLLDIPEEAHAVYLGVSNHGYINRPFGVADCVLAAQYSQKYKRVFNMCSTHAILYLSQDYIDAAHEMTTKCLKEGRPFDLGLAALHRYFCILTPNEPYFYQTEQPELTRFSLEG